MFRVVLMLLINQMLIVLDTSSSMGKNYVLSRVRWNLEKIGLNRFMETCFVPYGSVVFRLVKKIINLL